MPSGYVRVDLVGAGGIACVHAENLSALEGVRVTAVTDVVAERAEEFSGACGARAYGAVPPMLDEVDAVYVCSPPTLHLEHVLAAASAVKHVFCEKPLATTLDDGRAIVEPLRTSPGPIDSGFNNRFRPAFRRWRELVHDGALGTPVSAWILRVAPSTPAPSANSRTTPGLSCGITIESVAHDIDLVRWTF